MKLPIPDDWDEQQDGYACVLACIPNSPMWRATYRGLFYQLTWWYAWDGETGSINGAKDVANQVYEELCMANCDDIVTQLTRIADALEDEQAETQQTNAIRELTAAVASVSIDTTLPVPDNVDYSGDEGLAGKFKTHNWIVPDQVVGDTLANSLFGNFPNIPNPFNGTGIADILDDRIETLHDRFRMADSSVFNPLGEKNITEALETLLRRDLITDLETLLTPNIVTVLEDIFYAKSQRAEDAAKNPLPPEEEAGIIAAIKNIIAIEIRRFKTSNPVLQGLQDWMLGWLDTTKQLSIAQILMLLSTAGNERSGLTNIASAIKGLDMQVNLNNYNGCCDEDDCDCSDAETETVNLLDLCEQEDVTVPANGNGQV